MKSLSRSPRIRTSGRDLGKLKTPQESILQNKKGVLSHLGASSQHLGARWDN